jgi:hypothetical protein
MVLYSRHSQDQPCCRRRGVEAVSHRQRLERSLWGGRGRGQRDSHRSPSAVGALSCSKVGRVRAMLCNYAWTTVLTCCLCTMSVDVLRNVLPYALVSHHSSQPGSPYYSTSAATVVLSFCTNLLLWLRVEHCEPPSLISLVCVTYHRHMSHISLTMILKLELRHYTYTDASEIAPSLSTTVARTITPLCPWS